MLDTIRRFFSPSREANPARALAGGNARWTPAISFGVAPKLASWVTYQGGHSGTLHRAGMPDANVAVLEVRSGGPTGVEVLAVWPLSLTVANPYQPSPHLAYGGYPSSSSTTITTQPGVEKVMLCPLESDRPCFIWFCLPMPTPTDPDRKICSKFAPPTPAGLHLTNPAAFSEKNSCYIDEHTGAITCPTDAELDGAVIDLSNCYDDGTGQQLCNVQTSRGVITLPVACCDACSKGEACTECGDASGKLGAGEPVAFIPKMMTKVKSNVGAVFGLAGHFLTGRAST